MRCPQTYVHVHHAACLRVGTVLAPARNEVVTPWHAVGPTGCICGEKEERRDEASGEHGAVV